ncbi:MAG: CotH kinase family protein [Bacteroidota bacterium]|jgi:hypothetical protein
MKVVFGFKFKWILRVVFIGLVLSALFVAWLFFGPGWRRLTPSMSDWDLVEDSNGNIISAKTDFSISDPGFFVEFRFIAKGVKAFDIVINGRDLAPFYKPEPTLGENDSTFSPISGYNAFSPIISKDIFFKLLNKGSNSIEIKFSSADQVKRSEIAKFRLEGYSQALNFETINYSAQFKTADSLRFAGDRFIINVNGPLVPDEPKIESTLKWIRKNNQVEEFDMGIEARGSTSIDFSQVSYSLKFRNNVDFSAIIENSLPSTNWILYAPYLDLSLIRNVLAYDLSRSFGHYSSRSYPVEVIINGNYMGLFYLMEKIDHKSLKLDFTRQINPGYNQPCLPFLAEIGNVDTKDSVVSHSLGWAIVHGPPRTELRNSGYYEKVASLLENMEMCAKDTGCLLVDKLDFLSFSDFIILQELMKNVDAYRLSTFFHMRCESSDSKIYAGPIWDFNLSCAVTNDRRGSDIAGWIFSSGEDVDDFWTNLFKHKDFTAFFNKRYATLRRNHLSDSAVLNKVDSLVSMVSIHEKNHRSKYKWPRDNFWPYAKLPRNYDEEIQRLKKFLIDRLRWMDSQILR